MQSGAILVTGGTGYIGTQVVLSLLEKGERIIVLDRRPVERRISGFDGVHIAQGDYGDADLVRRVIREHGVETIFHLAALIKVRESVDEPQKYYRNNVDHARVLIETAGAEGVRHFVFTSTGSIYGDTGVRPFTEEDPVRPINPYADTKLRGETIVREACGEGSPMRAVILRFFNAAGADPHARTGYRIEESPTHITRVAVKALLEGGTINVYGTDYPTKDGTCIRDYVHVSDLAQAYLRALWYLRGGNPTCTFNIGYGHGYSVLDVIRAAERVGNRYLEVDFMPRRGGDPAMLVADARRARQKLGWQPLHDDIDEMIRHEIAWVYKQASDTFRGELEENARI